MQAYLLQIVHIISQTTLLFQSKKVSNGFVETFFARYRNGLRDDRLWKKKTQLADIKIASIKSV